MKDDIIKLGKDYFPLMPFTEDAYYKAILAETLLGPVLTSNDIKDALTDTKMGLDLYVNQSQTAVETLEHQFKTHSKFTESVNSLLNKLPDTDEGVKDDIVDHIMELNIASQILNPNNADDVKAKLRTLSADDVKKELRTLSNTTVKEKLEQALGNQQKNLIHIIHDQMKLIANQIIVSEWKEGVDALVREDGSLQDNISPDDAALKVGNMLLEARNDLKFANESKDLNQKYGLIVNALRTAAPGDQNLSLADQYLIQSVNNEIGVFEHDGKRITEKTLLEAYIYLQDKQQYKDSYDLVQSYATKQGVIGSPQDKEEVIQAALKAFILQSLQSASITRSSSIEMLYTGVMSIIEKTPNTLTTYERTMLNRLPPETKELFKQKVDVVNQIALLKQKKSNLEYQVDTIKKVSKQVEQALSSDNPDDRKNLKGKLENPSNWLPLQDEARNSLKTRLDSEPSTSQEQEGQKLLEEILSPYNTKLTELSENKAGLQNTLENVDNTLKNHNQIIIQSASTALEKAIAETELHGAKEKLHGAKEEWRGEKQHYAKLEAKERRLEAKERRVNILAATVGAVLIVLASITPLGAAITAGVFTLGAILALGGMIMALQNTPNIGATKESKVTNATPDSTMKQPILPINQKVVTPTRASTINHKTQKDIQSPEIEEQKSYNNNPNTQP